MNDPNLAFTAFQQWWQKIVPSYGTLTDDAIEGGILSGRPDCNAWSTLRMHVTTLTRVPGPPALPYPYKSMVDNWNKALSGLSADLSTYLIPVCNGQYQYQITFGFDLDRLFAAGDEASDRAHNGPIAIVPG
jgi:hypothetical protein